MTGLFAKADDLDAEGEIASGGGTSWLDVYNAGAESVRARHNLNAKYRLFDEALQRRNAAVFEATGEKIDLPLETYIDPMTGPEIMPPWSQEGLDRYQERLRDIQARHPDKAAIIKADLSPMEEAYARGRDASAAEADVKARYRGAWGTGGLATFAGGMRGSLESPETWLQMLLGGGPAKSGLQALLWSGVKQGAINATAEAALQPAIASWHKEAGIDYTASDFLLNVGTAFAFGAALDAGGRGFNRSVQAMRGRVAVLDDAGNVIGHQSREQALEVAALKSDIALLRKAHGGDIDAMRELAKQAGADGDPVLQSAFEMADDIEATRVHIDGADPFDVESHELQAMRHLDDPDNEPLPVLPEPLPPARADADLPEYVLQIRDAINRAEMSVPQMASALRQAPEALDRSMAPLPQKVRDARAIASLAPPAFDKVMSGEASAKHAALVARHVEDKAAQAEVLDILERHAPETEKQARRIIQAVTPEASRTGGGTGGPRLDDTLGAEADAQIAALEAHLGLAEPKPPAGGVTGLLAGRAAPDLKHLDAGVKRVMEAVQRGGTQEVKAELLAMGQATARDAAARLAGDKIATFETLSGRQKVDLVAARALKKWADTLGDDPVAVHLRGEAEALEAQALPPPKAVDWERAKAFGAKAADKPKVAHPHFAGLKLPLEPDGTVLMFRGDSAARPAKGKYGGRIFTTDLVRALRNAPEGDVKVVRVTPEELSQADPRRTTHNKVKPDETAFTLSENLTGRAKPFAGDKAMTGKAAQAAKGGLADPKLNDLAGKTMARAIKRAAGAMYKDLGASIDRPGVPHPAEAKLKLLEEADGTVLMFQGRSPDKPLGPVAARIFSSDIEKAIAAAPGGDIRVVRVPVDRLKDADPRKTGGKIAAGEKVFILSEDLAVTAERLEAAPGMLRKAVAEALDKAPEAALMRSLDDVEALIRMREIIEECKL